MQVHTATMFWIPLLFLLGLATTPPSAHAREVDVGADTPRRLRRARHHRHSGGGASKAASAIPSNGGCVLMARGVD